MKSHQFHELLFAIFLIGAGVVPGTLGLMLGILAVLHLLISYVDYWTARHGGTKVDVSSVSFDVAGMDGAAIAKHFAREHSRTP